MGHLVWRSLSLSRIGIRDSAVRAVGASIRVSAGAMLLAYRDAIRKSDARAMKPRAFGVQASDSVASAIK